MALRGLGVIPVLVAANDLVASIVSVPGLSMQPTLGGEQEAAGERVLVVKNFGRSKLQRHDVVTFTSPTTQSTAIARLKHFDGELAKLSLQKAGRGFGRLVHVPPGKCWVESDNHDAHHDSRDFGPIPAALLEGKVVAVVWPPSRARWI